MLTLALYNHVFVVIRSGLTANEINWLLLMFVGIYLVFVTIMCFLSVGMTIVVIHLFTNSIAVIPIRMSDPVSGSQHRRSQDFL